MRFSCFVVKNPVKFLEVGRLYSLLTLHLCRLPMKFKCEAIIYELLNARLLSRIFFQKLCRHEISM